MGVKRLFCNRLQKMLISSGVFVVNCESFSTPPSKIVGYLERSIKQLKLCAKDLDPQGLGQASFGTKGFF